MNTQAKGPSAESGKRTTAAQDAPSDQSASAAFGDAAKRLAEVREYVRYYIAVQADTAKLAVRNAAFYAALGVIGLLAAGSMVVVAVVLLLSGIAHGIGAGLGNRMWLGDLIVGVVMLGVMALGARIAASKLLGVSRRKTVQKYESLQRQQRSHLGQDVAGRAENP